MTCTCLADTQQWTKCANVSSWRERQMSSSSLIPQTKQCHSTHRCGWTCIIIQQELKKKPDFNSVAGDVLKRQHVRSSTEWWNIQSKSAASSGTGAHTFDIACTPKTHPHHVLSMQALINHDSVSREEQELAPICKVSPRTLISCRWWKIDGTPSRWEVMSKLQYVRNWETDRGLLMHLDMIHWDGTIPKHSLHRTNHPWTCMQVPNFSKRWCSSIGSIGSALGEAPSDSRTKSHHRRHNSFDWFEARHPPPLHSSSFDAYWHRQCTCHCKPSESMQIHPEKGTTHPIVLAPQSCHQQGSDGTQKTGQGNVTSVALLLTRREVHSTIRKWSWHMLAWHFPGTLQLSYPSTLTCTWHTVHIGSSIYRQCALESPLQGMGTPVGAVARQVFLTPFFTH